MVHPGDNTSQDHGTFAHAARLREVSVQAIVEGSARARLSRAMNTRTTMSAQTLNLKTGEEVGFDRGQHQKDTPGRFGPAVVADVSNAHRGSYSVRWNNRLIDVRLQDIRRHLHYFTLLVTQQDADPSPVYAASSSEAYPSVHTNVWSTIRTETGQLSPGALVHIGHVKHGNCWPFSANNAPFRGY